MAGRIFISYRRGDDPGFTQALFLFLEQEFATDDLFMDVAGMIKPGDDFVEVLDRQISAADVVLAIVGPRWTTELSKRQDDPNDFVVLEIAAALRQGKRVIPVRVNGGIWPIPDPLPEAIEPLARRNAIELRADRFKADCNALIDTLKRILAEAEVERSTNAKAAISSRPRIPLSSTRGRYILAIVSNERTLHINRAKDGFYEEFRACVEGHRLIDEVGSPNSDDHGDRDNAQAFGRIFAFSEATYGRAPDILVTVGTQVSIFASKNYGERPRFFLAVSDPIASELISPEERVSRPRPVAGFSNGIDRIRMLRDLVRFFPERAFAFIYGPNQPQDLQMLRFLQSGEARAIIPIAAFVPCDAAAPRIDRSSLKGGELLFGWNLLNTNIDKFIANNADLPFIGQHIENEESEAIASFGLDFRELGAAAARVLVGQHLSNKRPLGDLPIDFSHRMRWHLNHQQLHRFGISTP